MAYDLDDFCGDCRDALAGGETDAARERIRRDLEKLLSNKDFVAFHCGPDAAPGVHLLYEDPDSGFQVLAHVNAEARKSPPHDHGESWAVYGQAAGHTDMTVFERSDDGSRQGYADIREKVNYRLDPGCAGTFGPRDIHAINFVDGARFVRVTGTNLGVISTRRYDMADHSYVDL
jgi:predicted metal-dependent enzyme (double-stranded beta helix superfamily)